MLKAWFKGYLIGIVALRDCLACFKRLIWSFCGPIVAGFVAQFVKCP